MENLETVSINVEEEYTNFLENENTPASKEVREACRLHNEAVDDYISAVAEDNWKHGFEYAISLMKKEKETDKTNFEYDDLVLSDEELVKTVENAMEQIDANDIIDMIMRATSESEKEEPGKMKSAAPIVKITYIASQIYKNGYTAATYLMNEAIKQCFEEMRGKTA